jgi:hypothetical protein
MSEDAAMAEKRRELDMTATFVVALVGTLLVIAIVVALQALYYRTEEKLYDEAYAKPVLQVRKVKDEQLQLLASYSLPDRDKGRIRIPIDRAMEIVAREAAAAKMTAAEKVGGKR